MAVAQCTGALVPLDASADLDEFGVACPECGQCFNSHRHMKSHRSKQHKHRGNSARPRPGVLSAELYVAHSVGGMRTCRYCKKQFTRVEGLKKRIKSGCTAHGGSMTGSGTTTTETDQVSVSREELPRARAPLVVPLAESAIEQTDVCLLQQPDFARTVRQEWKNALAIPKYVCSLREYCVICGQWCEAFKPHAPRSMDLQNNC